MRFAFVSVALLALAYSLPPGVHGAPVVVADHTDLLATRQVPNLVGTLVNLITGLLQSVLGLYSIPPQLAEQLEQQIAQALQNSAASRVDRRAPSDSISSVSSTSLTTLFPTTTSNILPVATDQVGTGTVSSVSSTPQASSTTRARMRRQLPVPSALPVSVLSDVLSIASSLTASLPVQSVPLPVPTGAPGSVTPPPVASQPTPSNPSASTTQV